MRLFFMILVAVFVSGCSTPPARIAQTESGRPEALVKGVTTEQIRSQVLAACVKNRMFIKSSSATEVVCSRELDGTDSLVMQLAVGNSYSTAPVANARVTFWQQGGDVKVVGYQWAETQMAFGQVKTIEMNGNEAFNGMQSFLNELKGDSAPTIADTQKPVSGGMSASEYRQRQLDSLMKQNLPYDEYQKKYRQIMAE